MTRIFDYHELVVWKKSHQLVLDIYSVSKKFPKEELYALTSQLRRAAYSVPANIVEGFSRSTSKEAKRFYNIADASLAELRYFLDLSFDLEYMDENHYKLLVGNVIEVGKILNGWIKSIK